MFPKIKLEDISKLYSTNNKARYDQLIYTFEQKYHKKPAFIARAPGRVNIIGEHIDYQGYGVLPAAIEKDCLIAVAENALDVIVVGHVDEKTYKGQVFKLDPQEKHEFANNYLKYVWAGHRAGVKGYIPENLKGMEILVSGNVPIAAGLSSSSALCVCSAMASLHLHEGDKGQYVQGMRQSFIENVIEGQRQTGTASGGMDQSISILGKLNTCLYIQFNPINWTEVVLPKGCKFIIMNSLVTSAKLQTAVFRYNKRVCECRIAVCLLAKQLKMPGSPKILKALQEWTGLSLDIMSKDMDQHIERKDYTQEELEELLGQPLKDILSDIPLHLAVLQANKTYKIWQAAKHVFEEAYRVLEFTRVCNSNLEDQQKIIFLGKLMNESQESCRDLYECSCPEIDEITELAKKRGAFGSRLTGAGWGGCTVSLVAEEQSKEFIKAMIADYYDQKPQLKEKIQEIGIQNVVFESIPFEGACIVTLD